VKRALQSAKGKVEVPVYVVLFGAADEKKQLREARRSAAARFSMTARFGEDVREVKGHNRGAPMKVDNGRKTDDLYLAFGPGYWHRT